jgi:hypothetical protein
LIDFGVLGFWGFGDEEVEQYINGVIKYIPITGSKRIGLMTEIK